MEALITITNFLIVGLIIISPILILLVLKRLNSKRTLIIYSLNSLVISASLIILFAWWSEKSDKILLDHYGYNYEGMNDTTKFQNVAYGNINKVKALERNINGIGWPLKAIFGFLITIPFLIIVYTSKVLIDRINNNKTRPNTG